MTCERRELVRSTRHVGECHMAGKRSRGVTQEQARRALWDQVPACTHCKPDAELGILE
ncbi:DUF6233 domain-containing protein [Streptomyces sp. NPDC058287]|uniref:DUF6233 domain-containing protein n=1 Tax=unclassified Streptomyces TaxID=2593676 RepID=UPI0036E05C84